MPFISRFYPLVSLSLFAVYIPFSRNFSFTTGKWRKLALQLEERRFLLKFPSFERKKKISIKTDASFILSNFSSSLLEHDEQSCDGSREI